MTAAIGTGAAATTGASTGVASYTLANSLSVFGSKAEVMQQRQ